MSQKVSHQILLKGAAREHMMFVEGGDPLDVPVESLTVIPSSDLERREGEPCGAGQGHSPPIVGRGYANRRLPENQLPLRPSRPVAARSHPPLPHTPTPPTPTQDFPPQKLRS